MSTTDLAIETRVLFERVAEAVKTSGSPQTGVTVLHLWRTVLGHDRTKDDALLRSLAVIASRLARLDDQITESSIIDNNQKRVAQELVRGLMGWTKLDIFQRDIRDFLGPIHPDKIALLGFLSIALKSEYSAATLSQTELKEIAEQIDELGVLVMDANIEPSLKKLLIGHIYYMSWVINNIHIVGTEGVYDAFGPAVLTAREAAGVTEDDRAPSGKSIYERTREIAGKVFRFLEGTDKTVQLIENFKDDIDGILP